MFVSLENEINTSKPNGFTPLNIDAPNVDNIIQSASEKHGVDPDLIKSIVKAESNFDPNATSPKGAQGLMQIMPKTGKELGLKNPYDPQENIEVGTRYFKSLLDRYDGNFTKALAAYNWGMGNLDRQSLDKMPEETKKYIDKVNKNFKQTDKKVEKKSNFTPLNIAPEPEEEVIEDIPPEEDNALVEGAKKVGGVVAEGAKWLGKQTVGAAEVAMGMSSGVVLWPFSKAWGVLNLPWGAEAAKKAEHSIQALGYSPYADEGKAAMNLVGKGFEIFLKPSHMAEKETEKHSPEAAYLVGLGGELAQFAMTGGLVRGVKGKLTPKAKWEKPITKAEKLDTEFAETLKAEQINEINIRRAKQKVQGKPLSRLKRTEEQLAIEREYKGKQTELETTFREIPLEEEIGFAEKADAPTKIKGDKIIDVTPEMQLTPKEIAQNKKVDLKRHGETKQPIPNGWKIAIQPTWRRRAGWKAEVDWRDKRIVFENKKYTKDVDIVNHEVAHVLIEEKISESGSPQKMSDIKSPLLKEYANIKKENDIHPNFVREHLAMDYGDFLTDKAKVNSEIVELFNKHFGESKPKPQDFTKIEITPEKGKPIEDIKIELEARPLKDTLLEARPLKDTLKDFNAVIGERGAIGKADLSKTQVEALNRLKRDVVVFKRNAKRVNKTVEDYLIDLKVDPKVAALLGEKVTELKKYAGSINLEKQDVPKEFKEFETAIAKPKKTQTWDETGELSKEILSDYNKSAKALKKGKEGEGVSAAEADAIRQMNVNAIDTLKQTLETDPKNFKKQFDTYNENIFKATTNAASEVGRALNIHKKNISVNRMVKAFHKLKRGLNPRELKEFKELNLNDPIEVKRFIKRLGDPKTSDYFLEYWYNSILSGPPTHVVNTAGNTLWMTYQIPHGTMTAAIDLPYSKLTGKPRTRYMNEIVPMLLGYKTGFGRGRKSAGQIMRTGKIQEFETKWAQEMGATMGAFQRSPNKFMQKLGKVITPPTNALRAMDAWGNAMAYDAAVGQMARRVSNKKGLKGKERAEFENKFAENLTRKQHEEAQAQAKHFTFMDDPDPVTGLIIKARNAKVIGPAMRMTVLPFVNTISNLMKRGMEITPVVGIAKEGISRGMGRGKSTPEVIAKQIQGTIIAFYVWDKIGRGQITGGMPESKPERESWYNQGKMPWSIKMNDTWISYRRVEPFNTVIASAYVAYEAAMKEDDQRKVDEIFFEVAQGMKNNVIDGSYFQGLQAVMNRHQKSKGAVARWTASWVPHSSFFRSMSRAYEVVTEGSAKAREGGEYQKAFSSVLPWLVNKPPAKLNVWGDEAVIPGGMLRQWLPFKWGKEKDDPVERELANLSKRLEAKGLKGFYPSIPSQTIKIKGKETKLDDDIYRKYVHSFGARAKAKIHQIVTTKSYQAAAKRGNRDIQHSKLLKRYLTKLRNIERRRAIREQLKRNKEK